MAEFALQAVPPNTKRCSGCKEFKPLDEFPRNRTTKDGLVPYCKPCHLKNGKESIIRNWGNGRHYHLMQRYGIGEPEVDALIAAQEGKCAICTAELERPHVDHCHTTGKVRGILCFNCNAGLGKFRDNIEVMKAAITYLEVGQ